MRFTVDGSQKFEKLILDQMKQIAAKAGPIFDEEHLHSIVLGGGYGKGEGGVLQVDGQEKTFNDYDLFVITSDITGSQKKRYYRELEKISENLTEKFGIDVDFAFPINISEIKRLPFTQMWGELRHGYYTVLGKDGAVDIYPHSDLVMLPHSEAKKLILNRGVGLKLAGDRLKEIQDSEKIQSEDIDFISRNLVKAVLGLGDAHLILKGKFHHSYRTRLELVVKLDNLTDEFKSVYSEAVDYKLHPRLNYGIKELETFYEKVQTMFSREFKSFYFKGERDCYVKNFLLNVRTFGIFPDLNWYFKYPRERLFYALPYFLFNDNKQNEKDVATALGLKGGIHKIEMWKRFYIIWQVYN